MQPALLLSALITLLPDVALAQTVADCGDLTALQRWAGYLTWLGLFKVLGIAVFSVGVMFLFGGIIVRIVVSLRYVLEALAYIVSFGLIASGYFTPNAYQLWPIMIGCLLFAGSVYYTIVLHEIKGDDPRTLFSLFMIVWGAVAVFYNESAIGFLAVMALMGVVGFSIMVGPMSYAFGYEKREAVPAGTMTALLVLGAYAVVFLYWKDAPSFVNVFMPGALWVGSFVGFIGILILSSAYYDDDNGRYWLMQPVAIGIFAVAITLGLVFDIVPLPGMAGTFLVLYFASKPLELDMKDAITIGIALMLCGGILAGAWYFASANPAVAGHFIAMVK